ncbi:pitrilysin family protein [Streptomyces sp. NRRL S-31]|uniref:M16 family metallopeptidase n=1 Tax=Streptomyces sp. NRRL S-31 TaxID=1463898 RepID=UPI0004C5CEC4|nr:pitrilysin family protein [Streptomyces sp. NRRL S-31]
MSLSTPSLPGRVRIRTVVDDRLHTTSACMGIRYGSRDDPDGLGGCAHLLEHLLMSAPLREGASFCEYVERLGGESNAQTGLETMLVHAQVLPQDAGETVERMLDAVLRPRLSRQLLDAERSVVKQELLAAAADPSDTVQDAFLAALFPGHPLGRPVGGTAPGLDRLDLDAVIEQHAATLVTAPITLVVVGPELPSGLADTAAPTTPAPTAPAPVPAHVPLPPVGGSDPPPPPGDDFHWMVMGARSPRADVPDRAAYGVLAALLGSSSASLLYRTVRNEHGLSYSFQAWDRGYREAGAWRILIGAGPAEADRVRKLVERLLGDVAAGRFTEADIDAARRQATMRLVVDRDNPLEYARRLAESSCTRPDRTIDEECALIDGVAPEAVAAAAGQVVDDLVFVHRS